jgi:hypothetical protein
LAFRGSWAKLHAHTSKLLCETSIVGRKYSKILLDLEAIFASNCLRSFPDPTDDIINARSDILFRLGVVSGEAEPFESGDDAVAYINTLAFSRTLHTFTPPLLLFFLCSDDCWAT